MIKQLPEHKLLRKTLRYEPETGKLFWLERSVEMFPKPHFADIWNARFAGVEAMSCIDGNGYKHGELLGSKCRTHRVVWKMHYGHDPSGEIDHVNGNKTDNRIENLRDVTKSINQRNAKKSSNNKSGFNGVSWDKRNNKWRAYIEDNGSRKCLGRFVNISDAVLARKNAEFGNQYTERHGQ